MVPESATAVVSGDLADLQAKLDAFVAEHKLRGELQEEAGQYKVTIIGKSAHGAMPASGVNGATYLALFLSQFDFADPAKDYLDIAGKILLNDHEGENLKIAHVDEKMGALSMNAGVFRFDETSADNTIALNIRYPKGTSPEQIKSILENLPVASVSLSEHGHTPHYVPMEDPLVQTLLNVYENKLDLKVTSKLSVVEPLVVCSNAELPTVPCSQTQLTPCTKPMNLSPWMISSEQQQSMPKLFTN